MTLLSRGATTEALLQAARVVATAERPAEALAAVLSAARQCLGATGAAILRADGQDLVPLASDALAVAACALDAPPALGADEVLYPLGAAARVEGALVLAGVAPKRLRDDDPALPILLDLAAAALRKRRAIADQDQVRALRALHEVAVAATGVLDPAALAQLVVDHLRDLLAVESAGLYLWDAETGRLYHLGSTATPPTTSRLTVQPGEGIIGQTFQRREPVVVDDYPAWEHALPESVQRNARAAAGVPLLVGDHPIGALMIRTTAERRFSREDVQILSLFAAQVAPAVEAARLYALSEQRRGEAAAREAELATVIEHLTCGVMVLDARGELVLANEVSRRIRGDQPGNRRCWRTSRAASSCAIRTGGPCRRRTPRSHGRSVGNSSLATSTDCGGRARRTTCGSRARWRRYAIRAATSAAWSR